jgi:hypothetical protein
MNIEQLNELSIQSDQNLRPLIRGDGQLLNWFFAETGEHYSLLSSISKLYENVTIYDIGTHGGLSALALSSNQKNNVVSYDIENFVCVDKPDNVEFKLGDFYEDENILNSPLIMFDIDPHDGVKEKKFVDWLIENNYKGTVIFDDINLNDEMKNFWNSIEQEKYDITEKGHWSGTGIVFF